MKFKIGDVIMFVRDILPEPADRLRGIIDPKIPKLTPCTIEKINKHHVWVKFGNQIHWLRYDEKRMIPATEAGIILFGNQECIKNQK